MANKYWLGSTSDDLNVAGNWSPSGVPADADHIFAGSFSSRSCLTNISGASVAAKTFAFTVEDGFKYSFGESANPFTPGNGFSYVNIRGQSPSIFLAAGATQIDQMIVETLSALAGSVQVSAGEIVNLVVLKGDVVAASGVTISGVVSVYGPPADTSNANPSQLTVAAGCTLAGSTFFVRGGRLVSSTSIPTLRCGGGMSIISGSAGISTLLETLPGSTFYWDAASTIANAIWRGGKIKTRGESNRTLTAATMFPEAEVDLTEGGMGLTLSNGITLIGGAKPKLPSGAVMTFASS